MPNLADGIAKHTYAFRAWRWAFFFPGCLQIIWGLMILTFSQVCLDQCFGSSVTICLGDTLQLSLFWLYLHVCPPQEQRCCFIPDTVTCCQ